MNDAARVKTRERRTGAQFLHLRLDRRQVERFILDVTGHIVLANLFTVLSLVFLPLVYLAALALDSTGQTVHQALFNRVENVAVERALVRLELLAAVVLVVETVFHFLTVRLAIVLAADATIVHRERVTFEAPALSFRRYIHKMRFLRGVHQTATGRLAVRLVKIMISVELTGACLSFGAMVPKAVRVGERVLINLDGNLIKFIKV